MTSAGDVAVVFIVEELGREASRRERLETRCGIILSSTTAIAALLFTAVSLPKDPLGTLASYKVEVFVALALLAVSAIAAILGLLPKTTELPEVEDLRTYVSEANFDKASSYSDQRLADARVTELSALMDVADDVALRLFVAAAAQVLGIAVVGSAVVRVLL